MNEQKILDAMNEAERKAWEALAGYKFWMAGYHMARWVNYNQLLAVKKPNPFRDAVKLARCKLDESETLLGWNSVEGEIRADAEMKA